MSITDVPPPCSLLAVSSSPDFLLSGFDVVLELLLDALGKQPEAAEVAAKAAAAWLGQDGGSRLELRAQLLEALGLPEDALPEQLDVVNSDLPATKHEAQLLRVESWGHLVEAGSAVAGGMPSSSSPNSAFGSKAAGDDPNSAGMQPSLLALLSGGGGGGGGGLQQQLQMQVVNAAAAAAAAGGDDRSAAEGDDSARLMMGGGGAALLQRAA